MDMSERFSSMVKAIFFGNYFYGICAVALAFEANLQQEIHVLSWLFYVIIFVAVVFYYTQAYLRDHLSIHHERSRWYAHHRVILKRLQTIYFSVVVLLAIIHFFQYRNSWLQQSLPFYVLLCSVPLVAVFYQGIGERLFRKYSLRSIGWLKPFVIGYTWAGMVTLYPALFESIESQGLFELSWLNVFLFIKNMMYVAVLCIMFDVKDYIDDYNQRLKTFVTSFGLRKTIVFIISPLVILGLTSFLIVANIREFSMMKVAINTLPFIALYVVARSLFKRKNIMYYLTIIDGLMLLKAVCGVVGMVWF